MKTIENIKPVAGDLGDSPMILDETFFHVASDYMDGAERISVVCLCRKSNGKAIAFVSFTDFAPTDSLAIDSVNLNQFIAGAAEFLKSSIPVSFARAI